MSFGTTTACVRALSVLGPQNDIVTAPAGAAAQERSRGRGGGAGVEVREPAVKLRDGWRVAMGGMSW